MLDYAVPPGHQRPIHEKLEPWCYSLVGEKAFDFMDANVFGGGYFILVIIVRYVCFGEDNIV